MNFLGGMCLMSLLVLVYVPRRTESLTENYVIDTLVVLDVDAFVTWVKREPDTMTTSERQVEATKKIKEYISLVIRETNLILDTLSDNSPDNFTLQLSVAGFSIGTDPLSGTVNQLTKGVSAETAVQTLQQWVIAQGFNTQYDYVILLTGYDLRGSASNPITFVRGIATIGALCQTDGSSVAIVEDKGAFQSVHIVAHELGHSLGAIHDGESTSAACPNDDRYIMSINSPGVTSSNRLNPWKFSSCSKNAITTFLTKTAQDHPSCLDNTKTPAPEYVATKNQQPGQMYPAGKQCHHLYGPDSKLCLGNPFGSLSAICTKMFCLDPTPGPDNTQCLQHQAAEGTCCGDGKMCLSGQCLDSPFAPSACPATCLDATITIKDGSFSGTCQEYVSFRPEACYQIKFLTACCRSCEAIEKQSEVCPYGDKKTGCKTQICKLIDEKGTRLEEVCCGTCGYNVAKTCSDEDTVDGMPCEQRVRLDNIQGCYDRSVAYKCCKTCQDLRTATIGCEYGDRTVGGTCRASNLDNRTCQTQGTQCCYTCSNLNSSSFHKSNPFLYHLLLCLVFVSYVRLL